MDTINADKTILTGIKPTGRPHLGNYLGMIQPSLKQTKRHRAFFFIADYHALTTQREPRKLAHIVDEVAATWLALGLDPHQVIFYRQSAIPEVFELMWVLSCTASKGLLNRAHAYKSAVQMNQKAGHDAENNINVGLFNYPMLMAADILAFGADLVPVGRDQIQHVEIARYVAGAFNQAFKRVFNKPRAWINDEAETVIGVDGRKMSKSYGNEIPIMATPEQLRRCVMQIVTNSQRLEEPKDHRNCNLFRLYRQFALRNDVERVKDLYRCGGLSYRELKEELSTLLAYRFAPARSRFDYYMDHRKQIARILDEGATKARVVAKETLTRVRNAVGIA